MKPAKGEEERVQLAIFCYQLEDSSTRTRLHPIELLPKEVQWKYPSNPGCWQDNYGLLFTN